MTMYEYIGWIIGFILVLFSFAFIITCLLEKEKRAFLSGSAILLPVCIGWFMVLTQLQTDRSTVLGVGIIGFVFFVLILLLPLGNKGSLQIVGPLERLDERDIIFARVRYEEGSEEYKEYYSRHPELKATDDKIRGMPELCGPGSETYHVLNSPIAHASFDFLEDIRATAEGTVRSENEDVDPAVMTPRLKGLARYYGAVHTGITTVNQAHVYTHVGRGVGKYGDGIELDHTYALVFAVEMDRFMVGQAPGSTVIIESSTQYVRAAAIAIRIAYYIRSLGYPARAHIDSNYRIVVAPVAVEAGLGEIGRIGLLMTPYLGPRVRLGAVTTNMPLVTDTPVSFGAIDFCETCKKCAENCPSGAIPMGDKRVVRGVEKWFVNQEACYTYWRKTGTDCAVCINVCPFSKPDSFVHNTVRFATKQSAGARRVAKWADDVFYGRFPRSKRKPEWMVC